MKSIVKMLFPSTWIMLAFTACTYAQFNRNVKAFDRTDTITYKEPANAVSRYTSPEFPGGTGKLFTYLSRKMKFPKDARAEYVNGEVKVRFIIDTLGNVNKEYTTC